MTVSHFPLAFVLSKLDRDPIRFANLTLRHVTNTTVTHREHRDSKLVQGVTLVVVTQR